MNLAGDIFLCSDAELMTYSLTSVIVLADEAGSFHKYSTARQICDKRIIVLPALSNH